MKKYRGRGRRGNRWMKVNYFSISRIHNGMSLDRSQLGKVLPSKVLLLNMCSFPVPVLIFFSLVKRPKEKHLFHNGNLYGNMLFSKCCCSGHNSSALSVWIADAFTFCNRLQPFVCSSETACTDQHFFMFFLLT